MLKLPSELEASPQAVAAKLTIEDVGRTLYTLFSDAKEARRVVETDWVELYQLWHSSPEDMRELRRRSFEASGNTLNWRHNVSTGKAFHVVETLTSYLAASSFPSDDWFELNALAPELAHEAKVVKELLKWKLNTSNVRLAVEEYIRWLAVFGVATMKISWYTRKHPKTVAKYRNGKLTKSTRNAETCGFELKYFFPWDVWLDVSAPLNKGGVFSICRWTREELYMYRRDKYVTLDDSSAETYNPDWRGDPSNSYPGGSGDQEQSNFVEYYGPLLAKGMYFPRVHAIFYGRQLVRLADSSHSLDMPYVTATMLPVKDSIYGMSLLSPNRSALHVLNKLVNLNLDSLDFGINPMFSMVEDGICDVEDVRAQPGRIVKVAVHGNVQPLPIGVSNSAITHSEIGFHMSTVDMNTGTGPMIGGAPGRSGERVTAEEILSTKDAGGARLGNLHTRLEESFTLPMLKAAAALLQDNYVTPEIIRVYDPELDLTAFYQPESEDLQFPFEIYPAGASYVIETQRRVSDIMQVLELGAKVPQIAETLDYAALLKDVLKSMRFVNPGKYIKAVEPTDDMQQDVMSSVPAPGGQSPVDLGGDMMAAAAANISQDEMLAALGGTPAPALSIQDPSQLLPLPVQ